MGVCSKASYRRNFLSISRCTHQSTPAVIFSGLLFSLFLLCEASAQNSDDQHIHANEQGQNAATQETREGLMLLTTFAEAQRQYLQLLGGYSFSLRETMEFEVPVGPNEYSTLRRDAESLVKERRGCLWVQRSEETKTVRGPTFTTPSKTERRLVANAEYLLSWTRGIDVAYMYSIGRAGEWTPGAKRELAAAYPRGLNRHAFSDGTISLQALCARLASEPEVDIRVTADERSGDQGRYRVMLTGAGETPFEEFIIDTGKGYSIPYALHRNGQNVIREVSAEFSEISSGKWFPNKFQVKAFTVPTQGESKGRQTSISTSIVENIKTNVDFQNAQFTWEALELPSRLAVMRTDATGNQEVMRSIGSELVPSSVFDQILSQSSSAEREGTK